MSAKQQLAPKVRWMLALIAVIILSLPVMALRSYIASVNERTAAASAPDVDERLVLIGGRTMIVRPEALGQAMISWSRYAKERTFSFELSDRSFKSGSPNPNDITATRIRQVAGLADSATALQIRIVPPKHLQPVSMQRLEEQRAVRLRDELVSQGVNPSHVAVGSDDPDSAAPKSPAIIVLLSK